MSPEEIEKMVPPPTEESVEEGILFIGALDDFLDALIDGTITLGEE